MQNKIAFIAPYEELKEIGDNVITEMNVKVKSYQAELYGGLKKAIEVKNFGTEIIISRGGTARLIMENLDIPVVEVTVSPYDLLRVIEKYITTDKKIVAIGYENIITGIKTIADILNVDIEVFLINQEEEVPQLIAKAQEKGTEVIIGDTITTKYAKDKGLEYQLIKSGKEAVKDAIDEAIKIYQAIDVQRKKSKELETILNLSTQGIISINEYGKIKIFNPVAEDIFKIPKEKAIERLVWDVIPDTRIHKVLETGKEEREDIQSTNNIDIVTNRVPIIIGNETKGVVSTFQDVTEIQEIEQKVRKTLSKKGLIAKYTFQDIIGESKAIQNTITLAKEYAKTNTTVLIAGESGTGKELFAGAIHMESNRKNNPFVAINCSALPGNLLESELFGYAEGAFTGARRGGKKGLFELAHQGTIFLDEISEMDIVVQARLLRVLEQREVMRLGDDKIIPIDVRVITATNRDLRKSVLEGSFREDLYYRIHVLDILLPSLRERKGDIQILLEHFIEKYSREYNKYPLNIDEKTKKILMAYEYPGNIRELKNIVQKLIIIFDTPGFDLDNLINNKVDGDTSHKDVEILPTDTLEDIERKMIVKVLEEENFNKTKAARRLNISRVTLNRKLGTDK